MLTVASAGFASPLAIAGGIMSGEYSIINGISTLSNVPGSENVPNTFTGAVVGQSIDAIRGGEDKIGEKSCDLIQGVLTMKGSNIISSAIGVEQLGESVTELVKEIDNPSNSTSSGSDESNNSNEVSSAENSNNTPVQNNSNSSSTHILPDIPYLKILWDMD